MRRGRYLKKREQLIAVRSVNNYAEHGSDIKYRRLKAVLTRRIYAAQSTKFTTGTNIPEEQYAINFMRELSDDGVLPDYDDIVAGDQVILGITNETTDMQIFQEERRVLTVKSTNLGVNIVRLNCIEP